jgi:competence protein ComEC
MTSGKSKKTILAPKGTRYDVANDYSIVVKVTYGNTSFLLTGDAEAVSESQIVSNGLELSIIVQSKCARNFPSPYRIASHHRR